MDERILFDQFHEALNLEPRPGAYERMRAAMTSHPVAIARRPAFRMRGSNMGLRAAAVLAAAVIAVAMGAAILASHHGPTGTLPAGSDKNVKAYQDMVWTDYNAMDASTSNNCNTIADSDCAAAVSRVVPTLQKWVSDMSAFNTPASFVVIDGQLRRHLGEAITELNAAVAFQKAHDQNRFDFAMNGAVYERAWLDPTVFTIEGTYPRAASSFRDAASLAKQALDACIGQTPGPGDLACQKLSTSETCTGTAVQRCQSDVQSAATRIQEFTIGLTQNPIPSGLTASAGQVLPDLARADAALVAITDALLTGDSVKVDASESAYASAILSADADLGAP